MYVYVCVSVEETRISPISLYETNSNIIEVFLFAPFEFHWKFIENVFANFQRDI